MPKGILKKCGSISDKVWLYGMLVSMNFQKCYSMMLILYILQMGKF